MREQGRVGKAAGIRHIVNQVNGDLVRLAPGKPGRFDSVPNGRLVLDGDIIGPADGDAVVMRRRLANSGVVIVALAGQIGTKSGRVRVEGIGLPLVEDYDAYVEEAIADVVKAIGKLKGHDARDRDAISEAARLAARRATVRWCGKKPQVKVIMMEG
jgi:ribonuclease J